MRAGATAALKVTPGGLYVESSISTHDLGGELAAPGDPMRHMLAPGLGPRPGASEPGHVVLVSQLIMRSETGPTAGGKCKSYGWAQVWGWPLNCDVLPLNIKGASRFLRK